MFIGRTALIKDLPIRLKDELLEEMKELGVADFTIAVSEEPTTDNGDAGVVKIPGFKYGKTFSPTAVWRGASERIKWSKVYVIEEQNIVSIEDYQSYGNTVLSDYVTGGC